MNASILGYELQIDDETPIDVGDIHLYQFTDVTYVPHSLKVRSYDTDGNRSEWSVVDYLPSNIVLNSTPRSIFLPTNAQIEFGQDGGITSPVWTLEGDGTLDQTGNYTAPNTPGTARIRLHTPAWDTFPVYFTKREDDVLVVNDDGPYWWNAAVAKGKLNGAGDSITWITPQANLYVLSVEHSGSDGRFILQGNSIAEYYYDTTPVHSISAYQAGDSLTFTLNEDSKLEYRRNGYLEATTDNVMSPSFYSFLSLPLPLNTLVYPPKFEGSGITDYKEYYIDITIV